ncbi:MAG: fibronectin type III domain-containing protein [Candidatus Kapaibacterium sp.]
MKIKILIIVIFMAFSGEMFSQDAQMIIFRDVDKVYLRWSPALEADLEGYNVYRRPPGGSWELLTDDPLPFRRDADAIANEYGEYIAGLYLALFGINEAPARDITDADVNRNIDSDDLRNFRGAMSMVFPAIGELLGEIYLDDENLPPEAEYRITYIAGGIESEHAISGALQTNAADLIPEVETIEIEAQDESALIMWRKLTGAMRSGEVVSYNVYRANNIAGPYSRANAASMLPMSRESDSLDPDMLDYHDKYLTNGERYYFYVTAVNSFGIESGRSPIVEVIPNDSREPLPPSNIRYEQFGTGFRIYWDYLSRIKASGFEIYRSDTQDSGYVRIYPPSRDMLNPETREFIDTEVSEGNPYYYYMKTINQAGDKSRPSDTLMIYYSDIIPPEAPTGVKAVGDTGRIFVSWDRNKEDNILGYEVERSSDSRYASRFLLTNPRTVDTLLIDTLREESSFRFGYVVYAIDEAYNRSEPSEMAFARMVDITGPLPPMINTLWVTNGNVEIGWTESPSDDVQKYRIYKAAEDTTNFMLIDETSERTYTDARDSSGNFYYYVSAMDSAGNEGLSSEKRPLTIKKGPPEPPVAGILDFSDEFVSLEWEPSPTKKISGYYIQRRDVETGQSADVAILTSDKLYYEDWNAIMGKEYLYRIFAYDESWKLGSALELRYVPEEK